MEPLALTNENAHRPGPPRAGESPGLGWTGGATTGRRGAHPRGGRPRGRRGGVLTGPSSLLTIKNIIIIHFLCSLFRPCACQRAAVPQPIKGGSHGVAIVRSAH